MSNVSYAVYRGGPHLKLWEGRSAQNTDHDRRQDRDLREFRAEIGAADADRHFAYAERFGVDLPGEVDLLQDLNAWMAAAEAVEEVEDFLPPEYYAKIADETTARDTLAMWMEQRKVIPSVERMRKMGHARLLAIARANGFANPTRTPKVQIIQWLEVHDMISDPRKMPF